MTRFVKICYFVTVFRSMHGCTNQFNMKWKKVNLEARKVVWQAAMLANDHRTQKVGGATASPAQ